MSRLPLLELLAPSRCLACRAPGPPLCVPCRAAVPRLRGPLCARCGAPTEHAVARCRDCAGRRLAFATARAVCELDASGGLLVRAWKDRGLAAVAALAAAEIVALLPRPAVDAIVAVPPARDRARFRGVDGACALAELLGAAWELPQRGELLVRVHERPQRGRDRLERRRNARTAFAPAGASPRRVLLVDDVYTTGATADACARLLRRAGAGRVEVVTFARAPRAPPAPRTRASLRATDVQP
jgi:ComF family protein